MVTVIGSFSVQASRDTPVTTLTMCQQVMMVRARLSAHLTTTDGGSIAMSVTCPVVGMSCLVQSLADEGVLQGQSLGITTAERLVNRP